MDYNKVLRRAWEITWHWKVLWILGFLASLGKAASSSSNTSFSSSSGDWAGSPDFRIPPELIAGLVGAVLAEFDTDATLLAWLDAAQETLGDAARHQWHVLDSGERLRIYEAFHDDAVTVSGSRVPARPRERW